MSEYSRELFRLLSLRAYHARQGDQEMVQFFDEKIEELNRENEQD